MEHTLFAALQAYTLRADATSPRKLVIIGDGACGKTSLLSVFTLGYFPTVGLSRIHSQGS